MPTVQVICAYIEGGKKIIITTVQKFPFILDDIGTEHRDRRFAIVIDEAHSSQGGTASAAMNSALSTVGADDAEDSAEDHINRIMRPQNVAKCQLLRVHSDTEEPRRWKHSASRYSRRQDRARPFHGYTMKQAIQEGFILDVLASFTPVDSYYNWSRPWSRRPRVRRKRAKRN